MSHKEILEKAIREALKGGWKPPFNTDVDFEAVKILKRLPSSPLPIYADVLFDYSMDNYRLAVAHTLFWDKGFAEALWGDGDKQGELYKIQRANDSFYLPQPAWQFHLQQMVIADDPIAYLGEHI